MNFVFFELIKNEYDYFSWLEKKFNCNKIIDSNSLFVRNLKEVAHFLIEKRALSLYKADRRKANSNDRKTTVDSKVRRLKELGYEITKEGE